MFRHSLLYAGSLLTTAIAVLSANSARAQQQGWPMNPGYNGFSESRSSYSRAYEPAPATYAFPNSGAPAMAPATGQTETRSFYPSAAGDEYGRLNGVDNRPVWINVSVPPNAQILFDDVKTAQGGAQRAFVSPPLARGAYVYHITAKWQDAGREVTQKREITVHPGDVVNVGF